MKGLLMKDIRLMIGQKFYYIMILMIAMAFLYTANDPSFVTGYCSILCMMFAVSSISYDEFDNGYAFLFTLPVSRKEYVREKYVFGFLLGVFSWLLSVGLLLVYHMVAGGNWKMGDALFAATMIVLIFQVLLSVLIPLQLKFGSEKGRMVQLAVYGGIIAVAFVGMKVVKSLDNNKINGAIKWLSTLKMPIILGFLVIVTVAAVAVSLKISEKIMMKKEF